MSESNVLVDHVVPAVGAVIAFFLYWSPMSAVRKASKSGELQGLNPVPFVMVLVAGLAWVSYSALIQDWYIFASGWPGVFLGTYYLLSIYHLASERHRSLIRGLLVFSITALTGANMLALSLEKEKGQSFFGFVTVSFNLMFWLIPASELRLIVRQKDASAILLPMMLVGVLSATCWFVYGLAVNDPVIWAPSVVTYLMAFIQLGLKLRYGNKSPEQPQSQAGAPEEVKEVHPCTSETKHLPEREVTIDVPEMGGTPVASDTEFDSDVEHLPHVTVACRVDTYATKSTGYDADTASTW